MRREPSTLADQRCVQELISFRDPAGNQFHRLSAPAYRFVGLLDGTRTVQELTEEAFSITTALIP